MEKQEAKTWERRKYNGLDGQVTVEYLKGESQIDAKPFGVVCKNIKLESYKDMQDFAQALSKAWLEHEQLRGAVLAALMGKQ